MRFCSTDVRAHLLHSWAKSAEDPGVEVCTWLTEGAPAGLTCSPQGLDAIFPRTQEDDEDDTGSFNSGYELINHSCGANDPEVAQQLQVHGDRGWLEEVTHQSLQDKFGANCTVSDFCIVAKTKNGITKKRMILDLKGVSKRNKKTHRVVLPRLSDLVQDVLSPLSTKTPEEGVEVFILDFTDVCKSEPKHDV